MNFIKELAPDLNEYGKVSMYALGYSLQLQYYYIRILSYTVTHKGSSGPSNLHLIDLFLSKPV